MRGLHGMHGLHGPDIRGVRPYEVIGLVWFANLVGAVVLIVDYLVVLPFPADVSTPEIERGNVILGWSWSGSAGSSSASSGRRARTAPWTGRYAGCRRTRRSSSSR